MAQTAWQGTTYGGGRLHRWLICLLRIVGTRVVYAFADVFVVPVCLVARPGGKVVFRYFRERLGYGCWKALRASLRNHSLFAQVVIDRFAMYAGKRFNIDIEGYDNFSRLAEAPAGFLQLSAHIGNYEIAGYNLVARTKRFHALVYAEEKESVMKNRERMFSATNIGMIKVQRDGSHVFAINDALMRGDIVSMPADRMIGSRKSVRQVLLGKSVRLPLGPFAVAAMRRLDVIAVNVMKVRHDTYKIYVTPLDYDKGAAQSIRVEQIAHAYVSELERMLAMYPEQWYNYYDFWNDEHTD